MNNIKTEYCSNCKKMKLITTRLNYHSYCSDCYKNYQGNYYRERVMNGHHYIYIVWNLENEALYIGSTTNKYRLLKHLKRNSHLNMDLDDWYHLGISHFTVSEVSSIILNKKERNFLEQLFINYHHPYLNSSRLNSVSLNSSDREFELNYYFESQLIDFNHININREKLKAGNIEVEKIIFK